MGLFSIKQKPKKEERQSYYIEPKESDEKTWVEQENDKK
jgi:hypothetical protein